MKKILFTFNFILFTSQFINAQNVGIGTNTPKAALDITSTSNGLLPPRMNYAERNAIQNPAAGLIVYCSDCGLNGEMQFYNGNEWINMAIGAGNGPLVKDASGITYPTVTIGTQVWMAENLRTTKYNDGSDITVVTNNTQWANNWNNGNPLQQPMMCWYNNDQATYTANKFGALYNWYAINPSTNGNKNVCPTGWHVPTDAEWTTLTSFLGGASIAGGKMKSTGTQYWLSPNQDATNSSGFSGLPGGYRDNFGSFNYVDYYGYWWGSTQTRTSSAWYRNLIYFSGNVSALDSGKPFGFSVRCVRD